MMDGTELNGFNDAPVDANETPLVRLSDAIALFANPPYSVYTPSDVVERLETCRVFTTVERCEGLKRAAAAEAWNNNITFDRLTHQVQAAEDKVRNAEWRLKSVQAENGQLRARLHDVKQRTKQLRREKNLAWATIDRISQIKGGTNAPQT